jgi:uncharacterized protein (TIGR00290 family)
MVTTGLLTTMTSGYDRVSGHGLRRDVLERQAGAIGLDLHTAYISTESTMGEYESVMEDTYAGLKARGTDSVAFGDVFLKGPKKVHSAALQNARLNGIFPLWRRSTRSHMSDLLEAGIESVVICVDAGVLDESFLARPFDRRFVDALPEGVDPCGENGEFHTFVVGGPMFRSPVQYALGEVVLRGGQYFCDVVCPDE